MIRFPGRIVPVLLFLSLAAGGCVQTNTTAGGAVGVEREQTMLVSAADARQVRQCLDRLDAGQRQSIALAFYQGLSHQELANHLEQPLGTVKAWVRRGLEKLGRCMQHAAA